ncbi:hypothetical protein [Marinifilum sp.]|uniref:hypothetical protein n=1 Tax=Marinifilum sp. TaxID=2033137 RepID=UPI003BA91EDC
MKFLFQSFDVLIDRVKNQAIETYFNHAGFIPMLVSYCTGQKANFPDNLSLES